MSDHLITNSRRHTVTTNYFDGGRRYAYRITEDQILQYRIDSGAWNPLPLPDGRRAKFVASDNNRVFILSTDDQLYWRCFKEDSASWVVLLFQLAALIGPTEAGTLIWGQFKDDQKYIEGKDYRTDDLEHWARAYTDWVRVTHDPDRPADAGADPERVDWATGCLMNHGWNSLAQRVGLTESDATTRPEIIDIAVGNWNNTVVTYYVLAYRKETKRVVLYYIDEEAVMHTWKDVPPPEDRLLDSSSRISASHSVVGVITGPQLHWIRMDAHQPGHIDIWPLNWTERWNDKLPYLHELSQCVGDQAAPMNPRPGNRREQILLAVSPWDVLNADNYPGWHSLTAPVDTISEFLIDVGFGKRPWPVPEPGLFPRLPFVDATRIASIAWKLYLLMATYSAVMDQMRGQEGGTEIGFLGENPIKPNCNYPVCCIIKSGDRYMGFAVRDASDTSRVRWQNINPDATGGHGTIFRSGMAEICQGTYDLQNGCFDWANETFVCEDSGYERCTREEDQGYDECSRREDQGHRRCTERRLRCPDWVPGWACNAANALAEWVCVAWTWVSNIVCVAWTWVSNIVCVAWERVSNLACATAKATVKGACSAVAGGLKIISCWAVSCWEK